MVVQNTPNSIQTRRHAYYQTFFWLFIFTFYSLHYYRLIGGDFTFLLFSSKELLIAMLSFYLWPNKWLSDRSTILIIISICVWVTAIFLAWSLLTYYLCYSLQDNISAYSIRFNQYLKAIIELGPLGVIKEWKSFVYEILVLFILSISPRISKMTIDERVQKAKLERDQTEWELQLLKSQLNPPLLFNTLNRTYMLLDKDSEKGKDLIIRLSHLMRFTLYDSKSELIEVKKEISFVEDFLILMKQCFGERISINWKIKEIDEPYSIRPLLIIPIIDSAFNQMGNLDKTLNFVSLILDIDESNCLQLEIECRSSLSQQQQRVLSHSMPNEGINNVKKRLDLYYENRYLFDDLVKDGIRYIKFSLDLKLY